jgi:hypothetical protein
MEQQIVSSKPAPALTASSASEARFFSRQIWQIISAARRAHGEVSDRPHNLSGDTFFGPKKKVNKSRAFGEAHQTRLSPRQSNLIVSKAFFAFRDEGKSALSRYGIIS